MRFRWNHFVLWCTLGVLELTVPRSIHAFGYFTLGLAAGYVALYRWKTAR